MAKRYGKYIEVISQTFPDVEISSILQTPNTFFEDCHVQYPADAESAHCTRFFSMEPIAKNKTFVQNITDDIVRCMRREKIIPDVVFAPNQPGVREIAFELSVSLRAECALWDWLPNGRFGEKLVEGEIKPGDKVLVFNGVTQQGRCVGQRLPSFVEKLGGQVIAAAVFAKGTAPLVKEAEQKYGPRFYAAIQVDIPVYKADACPKCKAGDVAKPWTILLQK